MRFIWEVRFDLTPYSTDSVEDSTPSMTPRPVTDGLSDSFSVRLILVPAAGTLLVITIFVVLLF